jgi:group I intron endonuclease
MQKIEDTLRFKCGIYEFFNLSNGKRYVGSSKDIYNRLHEHYHNLKYNKSHNKHFQSAWNKYGEDSFIYNVLEYCSQEKQFEREQFYLDFIQPEYNFSSSVIANEGRKLTNEIKEKISNTLKDKYKSGELVTYRQQHNWIKCYIYNIRTYKLEAECDCVADAIRLINRSSKRASHDRAFTNLFLNRYIISKEKFENLNDLINHINKNFMIVNSKWGKYAIIERDSKVIYYREITTAALENGSSKSTLNKHGDATKDNPYLIRKTNSLFYYSNEYIPVTGYEAVPIEKSSELLSGKIGESPLEDNSEITEEIKESSASYSVESEPIEK